MFIISFGNMGQPQTGRQEHPSTRQTTWPDKGSRKSKAALCPWRKQTNKIKITVSSLVLRKLTITLFWGPQCSPLFESNTPRLHSVNMPDKGESEKESRQLLKKPDFCFSFFLSFLFLFACFVLLSSIQTYRNGLTLLFYIQKYQKIDTNSKEHHDTVSILWQKEESEHDNEVET